MVDFGIGEAAAAVAPEAIGKGAETGLAAAAGSDILAPVAAGETAGALGTAGGLETAGAAAGLESLVAGAPFAAPELAPAGIVGASPELFGAPAAGVLEAAGPLATGGPASAFAAAPAAAGIETAGTGIGILDEIPAVESTLASSGLGPAAGLTQPVGPIAGAFAEDPAIADIPFNTAGLPEFTQPAAASLTPEAFGAALADTALPLSPTDAAAAGVLDPAVSASVPGGAITPAGSPLSGVASAAGGVDTTAGGGQGGILSFFKNNPTLTTALMLGGGAQLFNTLTQLPAEKALKKIGNQAGDQARLLSEEGAGLRAPLETGVLPAGQEAAVEAALNDAINATKSKYAGLGLSGSTMENDQINYLKQQANNMRLNFEQQMATTGVQLANSAAQELGIQESVFAQLLNVQVANDAALSASISRFAAASALGKGLTPGQSAVAGATVVA